jgi:hypothetical protein
MLQLSHAEEENPLPVDKFYVDSVDGVDDATCGSATSPCKTLHYIVTEVYENSNLSYVEINLQTNLLHENCEITHAFLSTVIIVCVTHDTISRINHISIQHINGNENTIKNSTISIPKGVKVLLFSPIST